MLLRMGQPPHCKETLADSADLNSAPLSVVWRSKEISKSNVVDDMVASNPLLYGPGEHPDHVVVIKYVPYVADSKRALDEYSSEIFMGGRSTIVIHNTCEDSLLAAPIILDLVILAELFTRIQVWFPLSWLSFSPAYIPASPSPPPSHLRTTCKT